MGAGGGGARASARPQHGYVPGLHGHQDVSTRQEGRRNREQLHPRRRFSPARLYLRGSRAEPQPTPRGDVSMSRSMTASCGSQRGATLTIAMIMLVLLTLFVLASMNMGSMNF